MLETRYKLTLDERQFTRGGENAERKFKRNMDGVKRSMDGLGAKFQQESNQIDTAADKTSNQFAIMARRIGAAGAAYAAMRVGKESITQFADFETGLVGVGKTADIEGKALSDFGDEIQEMSLGIPVSTAKLLELAQAAGQLGVKGSKDLLGFTRIMAELEAASDVQGEGGAKSIARILGITQEGIGQADQFSNVLVALGNDAAASESEILDLASRIAQSTASFDLSSTAILGISAGLKSLDVSAEVAGSTLLEAFIKGKQAIDEGGAALSTLEQITGKTAEQLKQLFNEDQAQFLQVFIAGLNGVKESGGDVLGTLQALDITEKRAVSTLSTAAKGYDKLAESIALADQAAKDNNARSIEAAKKFADLNSKIDATKIAMNFAMKEFGALLAPGVTSGLGKIETAFRDIGGAIKYMNDIIDEADLFPDAQRLKIEATVKEIKNAERELVKSFFLRKAPQFEELDEPDYDEMLARAKRYTQGLFGIEQEQQKQKPQLIGTFGTIIDLNARLEAQAKATGQAVKLSFETQAKSVSTSIKWQIKDIDKQIDKLQEAAGIAKQFREDLDAAIKENSAGPGPSKATDASDAIVKTRRAAAGDDPNRTIELGREALAIITKLREDGVLDESLAGAQLKQLKQITEKAAAEVEAQSESAIELLQQEAAQLNKIQIGIDQASAERAAKNLATTFEQVLSNLKIGGADAKNVNLNGNPSNPANFDPRSNVLQPYAIPDLTKFKVPAQPTARAAKAGVSSVENLGRLEISPKFSAVTGDAETLKNVKSVVESLFRDAAAATGG